MYAGQPVEGDGRPGKSVFRDAKLRVEQAFANRHGIPRSILLGRVWPNPDDASEPYWLTEDYEAAMDFERAMTEPCPRCGTRDEEWRDPETKYPLDPPPYVGEGVRCMGCAELARTRKELAEHYHGGELEPGASVILRRFDPAKD